MPRFDSSFPEPQQWNGDEPDPSRYEVGERCPRCGAYPGEDCTPWCGEADDELDDERRAS